MVMTGPRDWTVLKDNTLRKLAADGVSITDVAKQLKLTRAAVAGRARRLGVHFLGKSLPGGDRPLAKPRKPAEPRPKRVRSGREGPPRLKPDAAVLASIERKRQARVESDAALPINQPTATIESLAAFMCHWPIGNPDDPDFGFCGRYARTSRYCETHSEIARSKADPRETTRRALG
jgi:GcrA cell cycle regulator